MGRLQTFDSTTVVQSARDVFWDRGYDGASLADLETATGVNRSSLYHAFGSKRGLFDAAVADYRDTVIRPRLRGLQADGAGRQELLAYFDELREAVATLPLDSPRRGCLLVNCATGLATHDEPAREVVEAYRTELAAALRNALAGGPAENTDERVRTLASLSMSAMLLARVNAAESAALLSTAADQVRAWFPL
ncbi:MULTISPECIES: TetR/AcrR family transcriptional regulator [Cryobacterium]|uniref:TetR/AcrR family transcriptional regulator n=1 Tax=Cryobacterium zongtaii TaxID=1259217 RepID=A0A2S3Z9W5_9MICO|nr:MULTISPECIES: TetR/AcrR family transcriptional regulator [Cryobacterium]ASD22592.1 TetR family transcriptional regulator [Cryobacterium sp. LW097]MEC5185943.1 TetR/AcrR family transcriptional repressor of nem operon [Cryobacterium sp. MP_3.1]POH62340.1 TetR/AcrR family transcriptional regulator [Cryobacterium zongtaii]POH66102.1 TetR/AcrR family transcriptional regulator [Cryobacterium zongtaii]TFC46769.1 TetR/AcrR family transcriptional regulator [Cryobacterium sp. TMN-39-2]